MAFHPCLIIPIYNNKGTIREVVESLAYLRLPCIIVDDGSDAETQQVLQGVAEELDWVQRMRRESNGGKGAAMAQGFRAALQQGFTHAVQVDADGQHDARDVPQFLRQAQRHPGALILGRPVFGDDAPLARRFGRFATHCSVWLETLSTDIKDALYGFRCYPLEAVSRLYRQVEVGHGMVFDTEIAVRLHWQGVPMINVDTRVEYIPGGLSHFHYVRDNLRITRLHTMLILGMLVRFPRLAFRGRS
jgi:glycosyltransferase involved in cell wall biosynthesis